MNRLTIVIRSFFFVFSTFLLLTVFPLAIWLLFNFETTQGVLLALLGFISPIWGYWIVYGRDSAVYKQINLSGAGIISFIILTLLLMAPSGQTAPESPIQNIYSNGGRFVRFSPFNIIPEIEQMNVGTNLLGPLDPFIDKQKAERLSNLTLEIYREMEADQNFKEAGSVMGISMRQPFSLPFDNGHSYLYIPENRPQNAPLPVLVFLHGFGGPFQAYQWIWKDFAEEHGFAVLSPTYGIGIWSADGGTAAALRAIDHAAENSPVPLDLDHVWLAGLSNGGLGTINSATAEPDRFRGLILISPAMPSQLMHEPDGPFNTVWQERPVLLIHGEQDLRMPMPYLNQHVQFMEAGQVDLTTIIYPHEDHFLFFAQRTRLMEEIGNWIDAQTDPP